MTATSAAGAGEPIAAREDLETMWRRHRKLARARHREVIRRFVVRVGCASVPWNLDESKSLSLDLDLAATALVVAPQDGGVPVLVWPIARHEDGRPRVMGATRFALDSGRSLRLRIADVMDADARAVAGSGPAPQRLELTVHEGLAAAGVRLARRALAVWREQVQGDFCLADLCAGRLRLDSAWPSLAFAFVILPLLLSIGVGTLLTAVGLTPACALFGCLATALTALTGTLVCGASVSVLGAGLGGIPISTVLGILDGLLLQAAGGPGKVQALVARGSPALIGIAGLAGLKRPPLGAVGLAGVALLALSLAMGWARHRAGTPWRSGKMSGALLAAAGTSAGPGLLVAIGAAAGRGARGELAFALGLAVLGGAAVGVAVWLRTGSARRGVLFGVTYSLLVCALVGAGWGIEAPFWKLLVGATVTHILLQGSFFGLAYVLGEKMGGARGGIIACALEGPPPYCIFLFVHHWL